MLKKWILKSWFVNDFPKDPFIGGYGQIDGIKVHAHEDSISIELESSFWIYSSLQSSGMQPFIKTSEFTLWIWGFKQYDCIPLDWRLL